METEMGVEEHEDEEKQVIVDVHDELYRSPTKKYRIAVSSIDDLEPFDINESFDEIPMGSVTPPHRDDEDGSAEEEHSLETHGDEDGDEDGRNGRSGHERA